MYEILNKKILNPTVTLMDIKAPLISKKAQAGQFIILRVDEEGERVPLTVAGCNPDEGSVRIIFQTVGATTQTLSEMQVGDSLSDFVGPLGVPTHTDNMKKVCIVGGGVGCAIALPVAQKLKKLGCDVTSIIGFRSKDLLILEDEFRDISTKMFVMTDDGSYGEKGNVCAPLEKMLSSGEKFDHLFAIGPLIMMKFVTLTSRPYEVPCTVSMNPIMIDGTGMCGGCRLSLNVNGEKIVKFACVDGPDFDGYQVDFDEAMMRSNAYQKFERHAFEDSCNLMNKEVE